MSRNAKRLPSGKWRVRVPDKSFTDGKRHYRSFTADSKKAALYLAAEFEYEQSRCGAGGNTYADLTLKEAYTRYVDAKAKTLSPSTHREYKKQIDRDFPRLMNMRLRDITAELVQTAVSEESIKYSPKTVRNKHGLLFAVLKAYYPALQLTTSLPQAEEQDIYVPTSEEVKTCLDNAGDYLRVPILLASSGSLRRSEIAALTLEDITDLGVSITKAMVKDEKGHWKIKPPKTKAGYRFSPLPPEVIKEVRQWRYFDDVNPDKIEKRFQTLRKNLGLKFKFHAFRHYFASELHAQGVPDQYIAKVGGWKSVATLQRIYQHTLRDKEKVFNNKIVNIFSAALSDKKENENKKQRDTNVTRIFKSPVFKPDF